MPPWSGSWSAAILERAHGNCYFLTAPVPRPRRYPTADGGSTDEVRIQLMKVLFSTDIPDPRDTDLIGLAEACGVFTRILSRAELERVRARIELVKSLNLLGRSVAPVIGDDLRQRAAARRTYQPIPDARGLPLIGVALVMNSDLQEFVSGRYRDYRPICRISVPSRSMIVMGEEKRMPPCKGTRPPTCVATGRSWAFATPWRPTGL